MVKDFDGDTLLFEVQSGEVFVAEELVVEVGELVSLALSLDGGT